MLKQSEIQIHIVVSNVFGKKEKKMIEVKGYQKFKLPIEVDFKFLNKS